MNEYEVGYDAARKLVAQEVLDMIDRYTNRAAITEIKKLMARHIKEANRRITEVWVEGCEQ